MPKRTDAQIMSDISACYAGLSPENLSCDGEASREHINSTARRLNKELSKLFKEIGREVSESETWNLPSVASTWTQPVPRLNPSPSVAASNPSPAAVDTLIRVEKVPTPAPIEKKMKLWRRGFSEIPQDYIDFHRNLADKRIEALKAFFGVEVLKTFMKDAGWFDSMKELNVIILTRSEKTKTLVWCDSNQDFMVRHDSGGQGSLHAKDLV